MISIFVVIPFIGARAQVPNSSLTVDPITNVPWGGSITVTGKLTDLRSGLGIPGATITFSGDGTIAGVTTALDGSFSATGSAPGAPAATGLIVTANYGGNTITLQDPISQNSPPYDTLIHNTAISLTSNQGNVPWGSGISSSGTLTDTTPGFGSA